MPTPAWPITVTRCGRLSRPTRSNSDVSSADSSSRPIRGASLRAPRVAGPGIRMRVASHAGTGSDLPFRVKGSSSEYSIASRVRRWVISPTVTLPGRRRRLEPGGDVDRVAHHRVAVADLAGQHLAGVDPDPQQEVGAGRLRGRPRHVLVDLVHRGLHRRGRRARRAPGRPRARPGRRRPPSRCRRCTCPPCRRSARPPARGVAAPGPRSTSRPRGPCARRPPCSRTGRRTAPLPCGAPPAERRRRASPRPVRPRPGAGRRTALRAGREGPPPGLLPRAGREPAASSPAGAPPRPIRLPRARSRTRCRTLRPAGSRCRRSDSSPTASRRMTCRSEPSRDSQFRSRGKLLRPRDERYAFVATGLCEIRHGEAALDNGDRRPGPSGGVRYPGASDRCPKSGLNEREA